MKKIVLLILAVVVLVGCGGDTETSVLASPASTAKYDALGVALVAIGGTLDIDPVHPSIRITPYRSGDGFTLFIVVMRSDEYADDCIVDIVPGVAPHFNAGWTSAEKAIFTELYDAVRLTR
jgi:hypothetical protein